MWQHCGHSASVWSQPRVELRHNIFHSLLLYLIRGRKPNRSTCCTHCNTTDMISMQRLHSPTFMAHPRSTANFPAYEKTTIWQHLVKEHAQIFHRKKHRNHIETRLEISGLILFGCPVDLMLIQGNFHLISKRRQQRTPGKDTRWTHQTWMKWWNSGKKLKKKKDIKHKSWIWTCTWFWQINAQSILNLSAFLIPSFHQCNCQIVTLLLEPDVYMRQWWQRPT